MLLINKLKNSSQLTAAEKPVAKYILENPKSVITLTSEEVAKLTFSSQSNVIRLCKKMGFSGFTDFKLQLASEINTFSLKNSRIEVNYPFTHMDNQETIANNILNLYYQTITDTFNSLDLNNLKQISKLILQAQSTTIYAKGESLLLGQELHLKLMRIGLNTSLESESGFQITKCRTHKPGDVAIIISYYGISEEKIAIAKTLKEIGIPIILITSSTKNPLYPFAHKIIKTDVFENRSKMSSMASKLSIQFILDILFSFIFASDYENHMDIITKNELLRDISQ